MRNDRSAPTTDDLTTATGLMALPASIFKRVHKDADQMDPKPLPPAGELTYVTAEIRDLKAEVERLRAERDRLLEMQSRVLELLGTDRPDRLVHDLRNVLNERALFRALAETVM
jgi:hypothetical protein